MSISDVPNAEEILLSLKARGGTCYHCQLESGQQRGGVSETILFSKHGPFHTDRRAKEVRAHIGLAVTSSHSEVDTNNPKASHLL